MELEDWEQWRNHPVTEWVLAALNKAASAQLDGWVAASWEAGESNPLLLTTLRTRADAYRALSEIALEDVRKMHDSTD